MDNRFSQYLSDQCTRKLSSYISVSRISDIDKINFRSSLKYSILNDPFITIDIDSDLNIHVFDSTESGKSKISTINSARVSDFILGANRVEQQYKSVEKLNELEDCSAWIVVSAYYAAFFSAIEIGKLYNFIPFNLDEEDLKLLRNKSTGAGYAKFFGSSDIRNFSGQECAGKLIFRNIGSKPHIVAWNNSQSIFKDIFKGKDWIEVIKFQNILNHLDIYSPSRIRNLWNYKRSDYFAASGEIKSAEFRKIICDDIKSYNWLCRSKYIPPMDPCIIALMCDLLSCAVIDSSKKAISIIENQ